MDFGLSCRPTRRRAASSSWPAARAEASGFRYGWTFDSHVLWQEPFVIYSQILARRPDGRWSGRW